MILGVFGMLRQALRGRFLLPATFRLVFGTYSLFRGRRCRYLTEIVLVEPDMLVGPETALVVPWLACEGVTYAMSLMGI